MAMNKETIKADIKQSYAQVMEDTGDREAALDAVADSLADAVITAVKSITITYVSGLTTPAGAVVGTFNYTIQ